MHNYQIFSFAKSDLNPQILTYQKAVFSKLGFNIIQYISNESHAEALHHFINISTSEFIIIFDVDCIPLNKDFCHVILNQIEDKNTLSGVKGCVNHIDLNRFYVHPCFMGFSKSLYYDVGLPSFKEDSNGDVAQSFTEKCIEYNKNIVYWNVTDVQTKKWKLGNDWFGLGTVYENLIYHQYEIRFPENHPNFIEKCKSILK